MLKIAVCDDEEKTRAYLTGLIQKQKLPCEITEYTSPQDYFMKNGHPDLLFLDIQMDRFPAGMDGVALAKQIRSAGKEQPIIIFITGHQKYVFDAFDVGAFQYLLKPVDEQKFSRVLKQAIRPGCTAEMSQAVAIGEDGTIVNAAASSSGGEITYSKSGSDVIDWWELRKIRHAYFMGLLTKAQMQRTIAQMQQAQTGSSSNSNLFAAQAFQTAKNNLALMMESMGFRHFLPLEPV